MVIVIGVDDRLRYICVYMYIPLRMYIMIVCVCLLCVCCVVAYNTRRFKHYVLYAHFVAYSHITYTIHILHMYVYTGYAVVHGNMSIGNWIAVQSWVTSVFAPLNYLGMVRATCILCIYTSTRICVRCVYR